MPNSPSLCAACQYVQEHRRPWSVKGKKSGIIRKPEHVDPGNGVSVDQIISAQPVLITQMSGFLMNEKIWVCTTFVDHVRNFVYVHLMKYLHYQKIFSQRQSGKRSYLKPVAE